MTEDTERMMSIRIPFEIGRKFKAVCALRGVTARSVTTDFARHFVEEADELPPAGASTPSKLAAFTAAVTASHKAGRKRSPAK